MTNASQIQAAQAAAELIDLDMDCLAAIAVSNQLREMEEAEAAGNSFAAYWAGSASASIQHHYRVGAFRKVRV